MRRSILSALVLLSITTTSSASLFPHRPRLGMATQTTLAETGTRLLVVRVHAGSIAATSGVRVGDVIVDVNGDNRPTIETLTASKLPISLIVIGRDNLPRTITLSDRFISKRIVTISAPFTRRGANNESRILFRADDLQYPTTAPIHLSFRGMPGWEKAMLERTTVDPVPKAYVISGWLEEMTSDFYVNEIYDIVAWKP